MKTVHVRIEGRVQGVFFRDFTRRQSITLGLSGWVRNMKDGAVEVLLSGDEKKIAAMISWLHRGSPHAEVSKVTVTDLPINDTLPSFDILF